jgi:aarF domain-containing kinase
MISRLPRFLRVATYSSVTVGGLLAYDNLYNDDTGRRTIRAAYTLTRIGLDYGFKFNENTDIQQLHETNADRLFTLLSENKGLYIKLGQNIANQASIFPKAFQEKFAKLYDSAPTDSWDSVNAILVAELGADYMKNFRSIKKEPVASASVAQVHRATLLNGEEVALKVQHHYIAKQMGADLLTYKLFNKAYEYFFEIPISFTSDYIAVHLKEEVDFKRELENAKKVEEFIQKDSYLANKIHIPKTYPDLSTSRVLTAEWCEGEPLIRYNDLKSKYNTKTIMKQYLTLFSKMIFEWGFVHSDPHPGNLLVRFNKNTGSQELVLLDHGLYVALKDDLRLKYCLLWKSLFELNDKELKKIAIEWGISQEQSGMFASMSLLKPYSKIGADLGAMSKFEREEFMKDQFKNFFKETEKFPLELIFLGRTMRMIQLLNQKYRAPINRINLFSKEAIKGYYLDNVVIRSPWEKFSNGIRYSIFLLTLTVSDIIFNLTKISQYLFGTKNIEDVLQQQIFEQMKKFGVDNPEDIDIFEG